MGFCEQSESYIGTGKSAEQDQTAQMSSGELKMLVEMASF